MFDSATVLVVGAGPTGLLLASELLRRNVDCRVIDAHQAPLHWDRATVVHPRSLELFEGLGLLDPLLAAGVKQRIARLHSQGVVLGEIDLSICGSRYGFNIGISEEVTEFDPDRVPPPAGWQGDSLIQSDRTGGPRRRPSRDRPAGSHNGASLGPVGGRMRWAPQHLPDPDGDRYDRARHHPTLGSLRRDLGGLARIPTRRTTPIWTRSR